MEYDRPIRPSSNDFIEMDWPGFIVRVILWLVLFCIARSYGVFDYLIAFMGAPILIFNFFIILIWEDREKVYDKIRKKSYEGLLFLGLIASEIGFQWLFWSLV